jgi:multimeric flavodoxin WrbA
MKVLFVNGSSHKNGTTMAAINEMEKVFHEEGMQTMRNLARNMIWMMRCIEAGKAAGIPYPATESGARTNFIR